MALSPQGLEILAVLARAHLPLAQHQPSPPIQHPGQGRSRQGVRMRTAIRRWRQRLEADPSQPRLVGNLGRGYFLGWSLCVEGDDRTPS